MGSAKAVHSPAPGRPEALQLHSHDKLEPFLDRAVEILLIALIAFVPWPFGSKYPGAEEVVVATSGLVGLCFAAKLLAVRRTRLVRSWAHLPIALFLLLGVAQLVPLPHAILRVISPNTLEIKSRLLADLPNAAARAMPLTFYSNATRHDLRMVLACAVVFSVALNVLRSPSRIKRLLICISTVGGLVIVLALAQDFTGAGKVYWTYAEPIPLAAGGPFIGHNDLPLFVNLTIGASLALLIIMRVGRRRLSRSDQASSGFREPITIHRILAVSALIAVIGLGGCAVALSLSRSGVIALGAAAICVGAVAAIRWRLGLERWLLSVCVLLCIAVSFYVVSNSVNRRLATLQHPFEEYVLRWQIVEDIIHEWPKFPLFGTGLGTHQVVYPMFEHLLSTYDFDHAENEFAQMLEETGAIGVAAILFFVCIVIAAFFRGIRGSSRAPIGAAAFGLGVGLLAVFFQSFFVFGAHRASNAVLIAVECALMLNMARQPGRRASTHQDEIPAEPGSGSLRYGLAAVGVLAVAAAYLSALPDADRARRAAWAGDKVLAQIDDYVVSPLALPHARFEEQMSGASAAHFADPTDAQFCYLDAAYRWYFVMRGHDPKVRWDTPNEHERAAVRDVIAECNHVREICPSYGLAVFLAGELQYILLVDDKGADVVRLASALAPTNPEVFIRLAWIEADTGDFPAAVAACRHYLSLEGVIAGSFNAVVEILIKHFHRPDLAIPLAAGDPDRQLLIVAALRALPDPSAFQTLASTLETSAKAARRAMLVEKCAKEDASGVELAALAEIYGSEHDLNREIDQYQRALIKEYGRSDWRLNLAKALLADGRPGDAVKEALICLRLQANYPGAAQVIADAESRGAGLQQ